jgi:hypothetical protein
VGISNIRPVRFTVTFCDQHALDNVERMLNSDFIGLGKTYGLGNPRALVLRPFQDMYETARVTLEELRDHGALTFVEEFI